MKDCMTSEGNSQPTTLSEDKPVIASLQSAERIIQEAEAPSKSSKLSSQNHQMSDEESDLDYTNEDLTAINMLEDAKIDDIELLTSKAALLAK